MPLQLYVAAWDFLPWTTQSLREHMETKLFPEQQSQICKTSVCLGWTSDFCHAFRHNCICCTFQSCSRIIRLTRSCSQVASSVVISLPLPQRHFHDTILLMVTRRCMAFTFLFFFRDDLVLLSLSQLRAVAFSPNNFKSFPCRSWHAWWHTGLQAGVTPEIWCHRWSNLTGFLWQVR